MKAFDQKPPTDTGFYMMIVLDPNQNTPVVMGWGIEGELRDAADDYVTKNPRCRAYLLKTVSEISAIAQIRERDPDTGEERKRTEPTPTRIK